MKHFISMASLWLACGIATSVLAGYLTGSHALKSWDAAGGKPGTEMALTTAVTVVLLCIHLFLKNSNVNGATAKPVVESPVVEPPKT